MQSNVISLPVVRVVSARPVRMIEAPEEFKNAILQKTEIHLSGSKSSPLDLIESVIFVDDYSILVAAEAGLFQNIIFKGRRINCIHDVILSEIFWSSVLDFVKVRQFQLSDGREIDTLVLSFQEELGLVLIKFTV